MVPEVIWSILKKLTPNKAFKFDFSLTGNWLYTLKDNDWEFNFSLVADFISTSSLPYLTANPKKLSFLVNLSAQNDIHLVVISFGFNERVSPTLPNEISAFDQWDHFLLFSAGFFVFNDAWVYLTSLKEDLKDDCSSFFSDAKIGLLIFNFKLWLFKFVLFSFLRNHSNLLKIVEVFWWITFLAISTWALATDAVSL